MVIRLLQQFDEQDSELAIESFKLFEMQNDSFKQTNDFEGSLCCPDKEMNSEKVVFEFIRKLKIEEENRRKIASYISQ
jgi:hypothetical protein